MADDLVSGARRRRERLRAGMDALERAIAAPSPGRRQDWSAGVAAVLDELTVVIDDHVVETEGDDGLFERVEAHAPRLSHAIDGLRQDHVRIADAVSGLRGRLAGMDTASAEDASEEVEAVRSDAIELLGVLARHRHRGADLLYEAYSVDVGTGD